VERRRRRSGRSRALIAMGFLSEGLVLLGNHSPRREPIYATESGSDGRHQISKVAEEREWRRHGMVFSFLDPDSAGAFHHTRFFKIWLSINEPHNICSTLAF
jgi:hypothetical protein